MDHDKKSRVLSSVAQPFLLWLSRRGDKNKQCDVRWLTPESLITYTVKLITSFLIYNPHMHKIVH